MPPPPTSGATNINAMILNQLLANGVTLQAFLGPQAVSSCGPVICVGKLGWRAMTCFGSQHQKTVTSGAWTHANMSGCLWVVCRDPWAFTMPQLQPAPGEERSIQQLAACPRTSSSRPLRRQLLPRLQPGGRRRSTPLPPWPRQLLPQLA